MKQCEMQNASEAAWGKLQGVPIGIGRRHRRAGASDHDEHYTTG